MNNYDAWQLWLGCYGDGFSAVEGADSEHDCGWRVDCAETVFGGMVFDQDECLGDGADAGLRSAPRFTACETSTITFSLVRCWPDRVYLNVLIDMNADGDWNDSFTCTPPRTATPGMGSRSSTIRWSRSSIGGETEDYPVTIGGPTRLMPTSWGRLKALYQ